MKAFVTLIFVVVALALAGGVVCWTSRSSTRYASDIPGPALVERSAAPPSVSLAEAEAPPSPGNIMGIGIGSMLEQAREKFDRMRQAEEDPPEEEEGEPEEGQRVYWKLKGTEFSWIIAWADEEGKITRLRAMLRPDRAKPFTEIGDLATASVNQPNKVMWNLSAADGSPFRVIAQGSGGQATTIYMFTLRPPRGRD